MNGQPVLPLPGWLITLDRAALADAYNPAAADSWHPTSRWSTSTTTTHVWAYQDKDEIVTTRRVPQHR